ncbi:MAG: tagatose 1,6-diphosphate aldolase [Armatimonadetes bacterium]|nr:tagatose 1,6-diphosphate aldolase [Armatimonadota bacterium]
MELSAGKLINLARLADGAGRFFMLAVDQRGSLRQMLARAAGRPPAEVSGADMAAVKARLTRVLAPHATAVLTDPIYGFPYSATLVPGHVGLLLAVEEAYDEQEGSGERRTRLLDGWSVQKVKRAGGNAVKLILYYHPDASAQTRRHQQEVARSAGDACAAEDLPYLLEVVIYPLGGQKADDPDYARARPDLTLRTVQEFSRHEYRVDLLKLEFPADLRYTREFSGGAFDGRTRPPVYDLSAVRVACRHLDEAAAAPWVVLSAGVGIAEFLVQAEIACAAGASGFLCGRAIWQDALGAYPDMAEVEARLAADGVHNLERSKAAAGRAVAWHTHRRFEGQIELAGAGLDWYRRY